MSPTDSEGILCPTMLFAVVQEQDVEAACQALGKLQLTLTRLPSVGGFLGRRNVTLMIGLPCEKEQAAMEVLQKSCRQRVEYIPVSLESAPMPLTAPTPVTIGGAAIFAVEVEYYEEL
ncbi:MAG TPA: cyclic-di-AMP receptor [Anaerolineaceae bacterium]|jgi:uncharacterized protein YaaQ